MSRNLIFALLISTVAAAQTPVDQLTTIGTTATSSIGSNLTTTMLNGGNFGVSNPWANGSGVPSSVMTLGPHIPGCELPITPAIGSTQYTPVTPSLSIAYNNATSFTWFNSSAPASKTKVAWGACLKLGAIGVATNLFDLIRVDGFSGSAATFQLQNQTCLNMEINAPSTQHSSCITVTGLASTPIWCTGFVDSVNGLAKARCYRATYPYTQIGSEISISFSNRGNLDLTRVGNGEIGTASGTTNYFENLVFDYTGNSYPMVPDYVPLWSGLVSPHRAIDWTGAGVQGGIPSSTWPICTTLAAGSSAATINAAISSCHTAHPTGGVVSLAAGSYTLSNGIDFTGSSYVAVRGAGANATLLAFTGGCDVGTFNNGNGDPAAVCMRQTGTSNWKGGPQNLTTWTATDYRPGQKTISLASSANLKVGNFIVLDQLDDTCDSGSTIISDATTTCSPTSPGVSGPYSLEGNGGGSQRSGRQQEQFVMVTQCDGNTTNGHACSSGSNITINPGLYMPNWSASKTPQAWWANQPGMFNGIEDVSIDLSGASSIGGIGFFNQQNSWAKGVRVISAFRAHARLEYASHITIRDSYFAMVKSGAPTNYGFECYGGADSLIENNIFHGITGPLMLNSSCLGNVLGYNYTTNNYYTASAGWNIPSNQEHTDGTEFNLWEGNNGSMLDADNFHGPHHFNTFFRNRYAGTQPVCYASGATYATSTYAACTSNKIAMQFRSFSRYHNAIGNVLGTLGVNTTYQSTAGNNVVYGVGYGNTNGSVTVPDDANTTNTLMRWGNYDVVNSGLRFQSSEVPTSPAANIQTPFGQFQPTVGNTGAGQPAMPASFYYSAKPSWWPTTKVWPPIGPGVTGGNIASLGGFAYTIPAQDCATSIGINANGTNGVQSFNAATCYAAAAPGPTADLGSSTMPFGNQLVGTSSIVSTVTLTNNGTSTLNIASQVLGGSNPGDFLSVLNCPSTLAAGSNCLIQYRFHPLATGARSATLTITDDATSSPQILTLTGTGTQPAATLAPSSVPIGNQLVGTSSSPAVFTLTNTGTATLNISSIALSGADAGQFSQSTTCGSTLAPTNSCNINITFSPTSTGLKSVTVGVTDDAPGSPHSSTVTGTGTAPVVSLSTSSLTFSDQILGTTSAGQDVTLQNTGTATLNITSITVTGTNSGDFARSTTCTSTLAVSATCTITATFTPTVSGARSASISIVDSASGSPHTVTLSGNGVQGLTSLNPTSIPFGSQVVGTTSPLNVVTLTNNGTGALTIASILITGTNAGDFARTTTCGTTVNASASCTISVTFTPTALGARTASLVVTDNGSGSPHSVALDGTGTPTAVLSIGIRGNVNISGNVVFK